MLKDPDWILQWLWYTKTGTPPKAYEDFHPAELGPFLHSMQELIEQQHGLASLSGIEDLDNEFNIRKLGAGKWGPPKNLKAPKDWASAVKTGDSLIDKWEQEIAEGRIPDLTEGM